MTTDYIPHPLDTSNIQLSMDLDSLIEQLAKNVHEVWAAGRVAEGWIYSKERDDIKKTHPCIVPYEQLPESEKEYDRRTAIGTLKFIIAKGFEIVKK